MHWTADGKRVTDPALEQLGEAARIRREQADYYLLCAQAARLGIPVSLDDPRLHRLRIICDTMNARP